jgi:hypothetical protein
LPGKDYKVNDPENSNEPSTHGPSGQDAKGRFTVGNRHGKGNPLAGRAAKIRAVLLKRLTIKDAQAIADQLITLAKSGDLAAIKELLDRTIGKPSPGDLLERVEALEELAQQKDGGQ